MKKLRYLLSIATILCAVCFTSCITEEKPEPFTKDSVGEWMIGEWDCVEKVDMAVPGEDPVNEKAEYLVKITGIEDDSEVIITANEGSDTISFEEFISNIMIDDETIAELNASLEMYKEMGAEVAFDYASTVNGEKTKIEMYMDVSVSIQGISMTTKTSITMTKR